MLQSHPTNIFPCSHVIRQYFLSQSSPMDECSLFTVPTGLRNSFVGALLAADNCLYH